MDFGRLVDLTHTLGSEIPSWTGESCFQARIEIDYPQGCRTMHYQIEGGIGTHIDAPAHFIRNGISVADLNLKELLAPLCVLHLEVENNPDYQVSVEDLRKYEHRYGKIPPKSLVVADTGWASRWKDPKSYRNVDVDKIMHFPSFSLETAAQLLTRDIVGIGIDTLSPDGGDMNFPVHRLILGEGKYIIENLTNLTNLEPKGAYVLSLPLKVREGTEAPCRVIAFSFK